MWAFLGFIALFYFTHLLKALGIYKHFVILCIALLGISVVFKVDFLFVPVFVVLIGSFFMSLFSGSSDTEVPEPHSNVDWKE